MIARCGKINHSGVVESADGRHARVRISRTSACSSCSVSDQCGKAEAKDVLVDVYGSSAEGRQAGDRVVVSMRSDMGRMAVALGFGMPLVALLAVFVAVIAIFGDELLAASASLFVVATYYAVLCMSRHKLRRRFSFEINDIQ